MDRSSNRLHERLSFFKYMTAATARTVMASKTLRWSSPLIFNDPFDTPRELAHGVGPSELSQAVGRRLASLVESPQADLSKLGPKARVIVELARLLSAGDRAEVLGSLLDGIDAPQPLTGLDELRSLWRSFVPEFRILCLTEDPVSASMWNHYAGGFTGAVLEFSCLDELDSAWLAAQPVRYDTPAAEMFNAAELAEITLMPQRQACEAILDRGTFRKAPEWSNEREWRVVGSKQPNESGDYSDWPFRAAELSALYLGPKIATGDRDALIACARLMPHARVFQVEIGAGQGLMVSQVSP